MARTVTDGLTILDYLRLNIELSEIEGRKLFGFILSKYEWLQLLSLHAVNYKDCQAILTIDHKAGFAEYSGAKILWDGLDNNQQTNDFQRGIDDMQHQLEQYRNRAANQGREPERPTNRVVNGVPTPTRAPARAPRGYIQAQPIRENDFHTYMIDRTTTQAGDAVAALNEDEF